MLAVATSLNWPEACVLIAIALSGPLFFFAFFWLVVAFIRSL